MIYNDFVRQPKKPIFKQNSFWKQTVSSYIAFYTSFSHIWQRAFFRQIEAKKH